MKPLGINNKRLRWTTIGGGGGGGSGGILVGRASFFDRSPPVPVFAPHPLPATPHQTIWSTFSPCLRTWPILCPQFMTLARVVTGSGGSAILCCCDVSYFGLCNVLCTESMQSTEVYLGYFPR